MLNPEPQKELEFIAIIASGYKTAKLEAIGICIKHIDTPLSVIDSDHEIVCSNDAYVELDHNGKIDSMESISLKIGRWVVRGFTPRPGPVLRLVS